jgi:hypothetical protein
MYNTLLMMYGFPMERTFEEQRLCSVNKSAHIFTLNHVLEYNSKKKSVKRIQCTSVGSS